MAPRPPTAGVTWRRGAYNRRMRSPRSLVLFLCLSWVLVVLYPDPGVLVASLHHLASAPGAAGEVAALAACLPEDPRAVERYVLDEAVPYASDWDTAAVPWYFPTAAEALRRGRGDCESRAVLLAGLLEAKGVPHQLRMSLDHIWVDYPGKVPTANENDGVALVKRGEGGWYGLRWPDGLDLGDQLRSQSAIYWEPMPAGRKLTLALGLSALALWNPLVSAAAALPGGLRRRRRAALGRRPALRRPVGTHEAVTVDHPGHRHRQHDERREHGDPDDQERRDEHPYCDLDEVHVAPLSWALSLTASIGGKAPAHHTPGVYSYDTCCQLPRQNDPDALRAAGSRHGSHPIGSRPIRRGSAASPVGRAAGQV